MGEVLDSGKLAELNNFIDALHNGGEGGVIESLHKAQGLFGYLPREVQTHIAERLKVPAAKVYGVVTFYSFFTETPKGKNKICICTGTACFVRGATAVVDEFLTRLNAKVGETTEDGEWSVDCLRCVGACGLAPVLTVNGKVYARVTASDVKNILAEYGVGDGRPEKEAVK
jgi:NADH-quinone oxidoreductase subunit E/NADP-reducing hydrogenase subunit HndA